MELMPETSSAFAVHDFDAIRAAHQRPVDLVHDPRHGFLDAQPVQIDPPRGSDLREALVRCGASGPAPLPLPLHLRRPGEIVLAAPHRDAANPHLAAAVPAGGHNDAALVPERPDDNLAARRERGRAGHGLIN